jgi:hypothetical protein
MSAHALRSAVPLSLAALGLAIVPAAHAATSSNIAIRAHSGDRSTLVLSNARKRALTHQHVRTQIMRPALHPGSRDYFPQASGKWNFRKATGSLAYSGAIRFSDGKRSVTLTKLGFTRSVKDKSSVTAHIGKRTLSLFTLTGRTHVKNQGTRQTLTGFTAHLTKQGAQRLDAVLHHRVVTKNQAAGSFAVTVTNTTKTPAAPRPGGTGGPVASHARGVDFTVAPGLNQALVTAGLPVGPIVPATVPGVTGSAIVLPAVAGSGADAGFDAGTLTGSIPLSGGIALGSGAGAVNLTDPDLTLGTGTGNSGLSFAVDGGPEVRVFDIDTSQLAQSTTANGDLSLTGLTATLSSQGAATLNMLAGSTIVTPGETAGGLTVIVPAGSATA